MRWEEQRKAMQQDAQQKAELAQYQVGSGVGGVGVMGVCYDRPEVPASCAKAQRRKQGVISDLLMRKTH